MWPSLGRREGASKAPADGRVPLAQMDGLGGASNAAASGPTQAQLTGTPREQADRLFNRVMTERSGGDTARAKFFLPMAVEAYRLAGELDADGLYHLSLLQALAGDDNGARETAERILKRDPTHLLGLAAAADAARAAGDTATARKHYLQFLSGYESELKTAKIEYKDHGQMLPGLKRDAEAFVR